MSVDEQTSRRKSVAAADGKRAYEPPHDRKAKKDEDKCIALLHPTTKQRIEVLFRNVQSVTVEELINHLDTLQEIQDYEGINYSTGLVHKFMEDIPYTTLTQRGSFYIVGRFVHDARKHSDRIRREERTDASTGKIKLIPTGAYLKQMITCSLTDKKYTYRWKGLPSMDPKASLMLIVVVITSVMSLSLVAFLSLVNVSLVLDEASRSVEHSTDSFAELISHIHPAVQTEFLSGMSRVSQQFSMPASAALEDIGATSLNITKLAEQNIAVLVEKKQERLLHDKIDEFTIDLDVARMRHATLDESALEVKETMVKDIDADASIVLVDLPSRNVRYSSPVCSTCKPPSEMPCVKKLVSATVGKVATGEEPDIRTGEHALSVSMVFSVNMGACITYRESLLLNSLLASIRRLAGTVLKKSTNVAMYHRVAGNPAVVKDSDASAPQEVLSIFEEATNNTHGVVVNSTAKASTSYSIKVLPETGLYILIATTLDQDNLAVKIATETQDRFFQSATADDIASYIVMRTSSNEAVIHHKDGTTSTRNPSASPHVMLGLHGQSGAMHSYDGSLVPIIGGYSAVQFYDMTLALVMERPTDSLQEIFLTILQGVLNDAKMQDQPDDRKVHIYTRAPDGELVHIVDTHDKPAHGSFPHECMEAETTGRHGTYDDAFVHCRYIRESDIVVLSSIDRKGIVNKIWTMIGYSVLVGAVLSVLSLFLIRQLTKNVLDHIEKDYVSYKQQIEEEKHQFSELVKDVMPSYISKRIMAGEKLIVDQHPQLTFLFSDIVSFTETSRKMSTTEMVRLLGYMFMVEDGVAEYYNIHKIKTIGDAYFAVSGLEDLKRKQRKEQRESEENVDESEDGHNEEDDDLDSFDDSKENNQVYRMVSFACVLQLLLSKEYVHCPEKTECFKQHAGDSDPGPFKVLSMRMGIHSGPAIAGVVDVGRAPHFDCFGPSVNLSSRMESTAPVDRIQLSSPTYEFLSNLDTKDVFEFDPARKTLVKGYGTIKTYTIKATSLTVPEEIVKRLFIERAVTRKLFGEHGLGTGSEADQTASRSGTESMNRSSRAGSSIAGNDEVHQIHEPSTPTQVMRNGSVPSRVQEQSPSMPHVPPTMTNANTAMLPPPPTLPSMFGALPSVPPPS